MTLKLLIFLFFCTSVIGQNSNLVVKINSVTTNTDNPKVRVFTINYQIENKTSKPISFFLNPERLVANVASKMTLFPIYKIYINGKETELDGPFYEKDGVNWVEKFKNVSDYSSADAETITKLVYNEINANNEICVNNFLKTQKKPAEKYWILDRQKFLDAKIKLNSKEVKQFEIQTSWNLERYFNQDDIEYYLDERDNYKFELVLDLKKTILKDCLLPEDFLEIEKDKTFIEGVYISNIVDINLK